MLSKKKNLSEQANFSASDRRRRNFPTVHNGPGKRKHLYLINVVSKCKRMIRKGLKIFSVFHFWNLKLVPIDAALNSASDNLT